MKDMEEIMMAWNEFNGIGTKVKIYELPLYHIITSYTPRT